MSRWLIDEQVRIPHLQATIKAHPATPHLTRPYKSPINAREERAGLLVPLVH